ncbi:MBOAT family O-acyltransferase [Parvicella tangerina]|uniref:Peptidoglycan O-acetyltransferase n=1 Tax=Parvicella tangerina TaxID=2829795 RepID=A0A916JLC3_9FLAO|nr:MBOAT family O-acyltransferase [Parvicella tangerina]CAG5079747.1 Peptidoglycan O-acetyltransferase [Parvicella tangerina]
MLFNSIPFVIFFLVVVVLYYLSPQKFRWVILLAASYFFYMSWQPVYVLLITFTTAVSYWIGVQSENKDKKTRKHLLWLSVAVNLGVLFFFKYFNFLNQSIKDLLHYTSSFSYEFDGFDILLPVGISFYTFQTLSYNLDVYYGMKKPEKHLGIYALYVSFFPQLVAGPIERSTHLMPQFHEEKKFNWDNIGLGMKYMVWGFFKKVVIADRLSVYVNDIYNNYEGQSSLPLILGTFLFAFQLYCDFSAYSDIAKGAARILGFELMENFNHPFKSKNITEFWRRWHISLSTWLRDYLYTPLVFKHKKWGKKSVMYAILVTFVLCGLWHGARMTYVVFGFLQAGALIYELATVEARKKWKAKVNRYLYDYASLAITFVFILFSFIFFRADSLSQAIDITKGICSMNVDVGDLMQVMGNGKMRFLFVMLLLVGFILFDKHIFDVVKLKSNDHPLRDRLIFSFLVSLIVIFGYYGEVEFIYFQF